MKPAACWALLLLAGCATTPALDRSAPQAVSPAYQATTWTFGTAESAMLAEQGFRMLVAHVEATLPALQGDAQFTSLIAERMEEGRPVMRACNAETRLRPAVIFDVDETLVWNAGAQHDQARRNADFDPARWALWEQQGGDRLLPVPGAVAAVQRLRALGVTPIFVSNRATANAVQTAAALDRLGFGPVVHKDTMLLDGDAPGGSRKHNRRALVAERFCVIAQAGDQMGDFADAIDYDRAGNRRSVAERGAVAREAFGALWGRGWFLVANPVYGRWNTPALTLDDAVAPANRWTPLEN